MANARKWSRTAFAILTILTSIGWAIFLPTTVIWKGITYCPGIRPRAFITSATVAITAGGSKDGGGVGRGPIIPPTRWTFFTRWAGVPQRAWLATGIFSFHPAFGTVFSPWIG